MHYDEQREDERTGDRKIFLMQGKRVELGELVEKFKTGRAKQKAKTEKQQPANYRKLSDLEPWEIVKRWQESDDLYFHHADIGFLKVIHLQQLANLIHQEKIYEQCSDLEIYAEKVRSFPVLCNLSDFDINAMWAAGLRFTGGGK